MPLSNAFGKEIFRAKVAVPGNNEATIIPLGASAATQRPYKYALDGMQLSAGDDVYVIPISGTYVLLGGAVADSGDWVTQEELEEALEPHDQVITPYTVGPLSIATFDASVGGVPMNDLTVSIEPVQAGSGDPSPTNVRPITGWTGCNIHVSPTTTGGTVYPVSWQSEAGTVCGGTLDVTTGLLTVNKILFSRSVADMNNSNNYPGWINCTELENVYGVTIGINGVIYTTGNIGASFSYNVSNGRRTIFLGRGTYGKTQNEWKSEYPNLIVQFLLQLATPITYQLTPLDVLTLEGRNNVWADCGPVTVTYGDYVKTVYDRIQQGGGGNLPAGGEVGQALVKASSTDYAVKWATAALHISVASFSSFPQTISNSAITAGMRVVNCVWGTPYAITSAVTWTTTDGSLTLSGNISGSTTAEIDLILF